MSAASRVGLVTGAEGAFGAAAIAAIRPLCDRLIVAGAGTLPEAFGAETIAFDANDEAAWNALHQRLAGDGVDILVHCASPSPEPRRAIAGAWFAARESIRLLRDAPEAALVVLLPAPEGDPIREAAAEALKIATEAALLDAMGMGRHPRVNRLLAAADADPAALSATLGMLCDPRGSFITGTEITLDGTAASADADLAGKTVLVTGATSGIGRATAIEAGARGAFVAVGGRKMPLAQETLALVRAAGGDGMIVALDVTERAAWATAIDAIRTARGGLDGLVNNAGEARHRRFDLLTADDLDFLMRINVDGPLFGMEAAWPLLEARGGAVVNISSVAGIRAVPSNAAYGTTKAATIGLSRGWGRRSSAGSPRVRVNALQPGFIWSDSVADSLGEQGAADFRAKIEPKTPIGRVGFPEEIARPVCFLLSDAAAPITGQAITVSGGLELALP